MDRSAWIALLALLATAATALWLGRDLGQQPAPIDQPDIVLVTFDTTRADRLGSTYGYLRGTSPRFDALAAQSTVFEQFIVPMATTLPSHTSMFTGVYPIEHGIEANGFEGQRFVSPESIVYITEYLRDQGYETGAFISAAPVRDGTGMERGFDHFDRPGKPGPRDADGTTAAAIEWLGERSGDAPVFLWAHYFDPHTPTRAPAPWRHTYRTTPRYKKYLDDHHFTDQGLRERRVLRRNNRYDEEVAFMDDQFGRLVDYLRSRPRWYRTAVVVAGDHGEGLGQHGQWGHGRLWEEQLRSPLLMRLPRRQPARVSTPVSAVDLFPTLLGQVRLRDEASWLDQVSGRDVLAPGYEPRPLFASTSLRRSTKFGEERAFALRTDRWKYVRSVAGEQQLVDLHADPFELHDAAGEHPDVVAEMSRLLDAERAAQRERREAFGAGHLQEVEADVIDELEALGYMVRRTDGEAEDTDGE